MYAADSTSRFRGLTVSGANLKRTVVFDTTVTSDGKVVHTPKTVWKPQEPKKTGSNVSGTTGLQINATPTSPLGSWGTELVFEVQDNKILTFSGLKRNMSAKWASHSRMWKKDLSEFLGPGLQTLSFSVYLSAMWGVSPRAMIEVIEKAINEGTVNPFVVGGKQIGENWWKITSASDAWDVVWRQGELVKANLDITMEEYL